MIVQSRVDDTFWGFGEVTKSFVTIYLTISSALNYKDHTINLLGVAGSSRKISPHAQTHFPGGRIFLQHCEYTPVYINC